jgi:hypothetical protein
LNKSLNKNKYDNQNDLFQSLLKEEKGSKRKKEKRHYVMLTEFQDYHVYVKN